MSDQVFAQIINSVGTLVAALIATWVAIYTARKQVSKDVKKISSELPSWKLLYEHDSDGVPITGKVDDLIEAVGKAYPIKIKIYRSSDRFEMMDAQWVFVDSKTVHASNIDQISTTKDQNGNYSFIQDAYHYYVIVSSTGRHHATRINIDGRQRNSTDDKRRMAWYGLVPHN